MGEKDYEQSTVSDPAEIEEDRVFPESELAIERDDDATQTDPRSPDVKE